MTCTTDLLGFMCDGFVGIIAGVILVIVSQIVLIRWMEK